MRLTAILNQQHIGRQIKRHWQVQKNRKIPLTETEERLRARGIVIEDANEFIKEKVERVQIQVIGPFELPKPKDENHPEYKSKICNVMPKNRPLIEGLKQAQILTKTIHIAEKLPEHIENVANSDASQSIHKQVRDVILSANVYDAEQKKLPRIINPERPAHVYRREYGITDVRRSTITMNKLIDIVERNCDESANRSIAEQVDAVISFQKNKDFVQFHSPSDFLLTSSQPIQPIVKNVEFTEGIDLPSLSPINYLISIPKEHFYDFTTAYPVNHSAVAFHPHTTYLHFNKSEIKNLHETEVTQDQIHGRSLLHCFTIAASYAKSLHGNEVETLPTPVTVQCVQSDGCNFNFGVLQLNTLDMSNEEGIKNMWYTTPTLSLFEFCGYVKGIPELSGYNGKIYNYLNALYKNV